MKAQPMLVNTTVQIKLFIGLLKRRLENIVAYDHRKLSPP